MYVIVLRLLVCWVTGMWLPHCVCVCVCVCQHCYAIAVGECWCYCLLGLVDASLMRPPAAFCVAAPNTTTPPPCTPAVSTGPVSCISQTDRVSAHHLTGFLVLGCRRRRFTCRRRSFRYAAIHTDAHHMCMLALYSSSTFYSVFVPTLPRPTHTYVFEKNDLF